MAVHLMRTVLPALASDEASAALERILSRRGCRLEPSVPHRSAELAEMLAALSPGKRLYTEFALIDGGSPPVWVLDETTPDVETWDPALARELSAESGGFALTVETSRTLGRYNFAAFFAGRAIEFIPEESGPSGLGLDGQIERVDRTFTELYEQLTGRPATALRGEDVQLSSRLATGCMGQLPWQPHAGEEKPLTLAIFALADETQFAEVWRVVAGHTRPGWRWRRTATAVGLPYVRLTREGELDAELFASLARHLDVPSAAVCLHSGGPFDWWRAQPREADAHGQAAGAAAMVQHLMAATTAFGEPPGVLRL